MEVERWTFAPKLKGTAPRSQSTVPEPVFNSMQNSMRRLCRLTRYPRGNKEPFVCTIRSSRHNGMSIGAHARLAADSERKIGVSDDDSPCKQEKRVRPCLRKAQNFLGMSASAHQPFVHTRCHLMLPDKPRHEGEAFNPPNSFRCFRHISFLAVIILLTKIKTLYCGRDPVPVRSRGSTYAMIARKNGSTTSSISSMSDIIQYGSNPPFKLWDLGDVNVSFKLLRKGSSRSDMPRPILTNAFRRMDPSWVQSGKSHRRGPVPRTLATSNFHVDQDWVP